MSDSRTVRITLSFTLELTDPIAISASNPVLLAEIDGQFGTTAPDPATVLAALMAAAASNAALGTGGATEVEGSGTAGWHVHEVIDGVEPPVRLPGWDRRTRKFLPEV